MKKIAFGVIASVVVTYLVACYSAESLKEEQRPTRRMMLEDVLKGTVYGDPRDRDWSVIEREAEAVRASEGDGDEWRRNNVVERMIAVEPQGWQRDLERLQARVDRLDGRSMAQAGWGNRDVALWAASVQVREETDDIYHRIRAGLEFTPMMRENLFRLHRIMWRLERMREWDYERER